MISEMTNSHPVVETFESLVRLLAHTAFRIARNLFIDSLASAKYGNALIQPIVNAIWNASRRSNERMRRQTKRTS